MFQYSLIFLLCYSGISFSFPSQHNLQIRSLPTQGSSGNHSDSSDYISEYACEGEKLNLTCAEGSVIHLYRVNYGRFSATKCNNEGNPNYDTNCMSTKSMRVAHDRCHNRQSCSIEASVSSIGDDPCPNTAKYLEAHFTCRAGTPITEP